jgi:Fe-S oxidoreductase
MPETPLAENPPPAQGARHCRPVPIGELVAPIVERRKPISKRTRFEVFKRDGFSCKYCGQSPPDTVLEVDHVIPVSGGGSNHADNLVTACVACNRGKSNTPLSSVPPDLRQRAMEVAEREADIFSQSLVFAAKRERIEREAWEVVQELFNGTDEINAGWFRSIERFIELLGLEECIEAARIALRAPVYKDRKRFLYFCGVCWRRVRALGGEE